MKYHFMQIYGNCAIVHYLGHERLRGPADNVVAKGLDFLKLLLHGDYLKYIKTNKPIKIPRTPGFVGDSEIEYRFPLVDIPHNDITKPSFEPELKRRLNNFKEFKQKVLTEKNYYFVYGINYYDLDITSHKINLERFKANLDYLKREGLLNKIIFVETKNKDEKAFWNFYAINVQDTIKEYNLTYIQMNDLTLGAADESIIMPQFYKKAVEAIEKKGNK